MMKRGLPYKAGSAGFSLLETLNALAIFSVIFILIFGIFDSGNRLWSVTNASADIQDEIRRALIHMDKYVSSCLSLELVSSSHISFTTFDDETIDYMLVTPLTGSSYIQETRTSGSDTTTRRLANNVGTLAFAVDDSGALTRLVIDAMATKETNEGIPVTFRLQSMAILRNVS